jgi:hypothetical protein
MRGTFVAHAGRGKRGLSFRPRGEDAMRTLQRWACAAAIAMSTTPLFAQTGGGPGPGPGAGGPPGAASVPRGGPGSGPGGRMMGRWGADVTPGWSMMTRQERQEHQSRMRDMASYDDCKAYMDQHHEAMAARAKERGRAMPAQPRRDACAGLKR